MNDLPALNAGARPQIQVLPDAAALAETATGHFIRWATEAVAARGRFTVALSGGSTPAGLYRRLAAGPERGLVSWARTFVFFGDERCVPPDQPESNYRLAREALLNAVRVPAEQIFRMPAELPGAEAAAGYARQIEQVLAALADKPGAVPRFDLILLGLGDDGHTASLFPGMPALSERTRLVVWTPVPANVRPAVSRLTLTLPVLNAARHVLFLVAGSSKARAAQTILAPAQASQPLPAARVRPTAGTLTWLLDEAAAAGLAATDRTKQN